MIIDPADCQQPQFVLSSDSANVGVESRLNDRRDYWPSFFRAEDAVKQGACVGMGHSLRIFSVVPNGTPLTIIHVDPPMNGWAIFRASLRDEGKSQEASANRIEYGLSRA